MPVTVDDGTDSVSVNFNWDINTLPSVTNPGDQADQVGAIVNLPIVATDADGDTLSYSATGLPVGLTIDPAHPLEYKHLFEWHEPMPFQ